MTNENSEHHSRLPESRRTNLKRLALNKVSSLHPSDLISLVKFDDELLAHSLDSMSNRDYARHVARLGRHLLPKRYYPQKKTR